jgi:ATP-dependent DNA helicase RecG
MKNFDPKKKISELTKQKYENEVLEFKEAKDDFDFNRLGKYFSALANEANLKKIDHAWLVFGVKDSDKSYVNSKYKSAPGILKKLKSDLANHTTDRISFSEIYELEIEHGKRAILFQIPPAPQGIPIAWKGHYYAREDENLVSLNLEKIERIRSQVKSEDWSIQICDGATIEDLDSEAIKKARESYKRKTPNLSEECDKWSDKVFLNKAKVTVDGKITNTAILLLGKPESVYFISPAVSKISWILKSKEGIEQDYEHFTSPLIITVDQVFNKIRNLKYRYIKDESLFPEEVYKYDPYIIREALNNCIAHQDYTLSGKINVIESEDDNLIFSNAGSFLPVSIDNVIQSDAPSQFYRNRFLVDAMVNLNMIDTIGSGIRKMFLSQKQKFFPMPEYEISNNSVKVTIIGKVLDLNYAKKLAQIPDLSLHMIILLDKVQKKKTLSEDEARILRSKGLIEGKRPNLYVSSGVAVRTRETADYMKRRAIDDEYCKKMIIDWLEANGTGSRKDFENLLLDKLSSNLNELQKKNKIKNILQSLRKGDEIESTGDRLWIKKQR